MEFASNHIYIDSPASTGQVQQAVCYRNHPMGTVRNTTHSEKPLAHVYDPVMDCNPAYEAKKPSSASVIDHVESEGPTYDNWNPAIAAASDDTGLCDQASSSAPSKITAAKPVYDVAEGSSNYYGNGRISGCQTTQHLANPSHAQHRFGDNTHGTPPPLPPRPRNLKKVPEYVQLLDLPPTKGPGHWTLPTSHHHHKVPPDSLPPPLPDRTFLKSEKEELKGNINVVLVNLGKLVDIKNVKPQKCTPVYCQNCSAAISTLSKVENLHAVTWTCEFCNNQNVQDYRSNEPCFRDDQTYVHIPNPITSDDIDDSLVVFCVDISGSMSVTFEMNRSSKSLYMTRLQAVQEAIIQSLDYLFETSPRTRVALVTFNNEVTIYGDGLSPPWTLHDFELIDQNYLKKQGVEAAQPHCILESRDALYRCIRQLQECGATALGPAALVSIAMASQKQGSKVIICTDGRANTILGNLEDIKDDKIYQSSKLFYSHLAEYAMMQGVIISVLTIEGTDCRLPELGQLADKTGGKVNITNPANLYNEFQLILEDDVIATNVTVTFIVHDSLYFKYEDDMSSKSVKHIGNVVRDMEITFEFGIKESKLEQIQEKTALPFQVQIGFRLPDGQCVYRIITQEQPTTKHSAIAKDHINLSVLQIHAAQISARLAMEGRMQDAQKEALAQKALIEEILARKNDLEQGAIYESWMQSMSPIYSALNCKTQDAVTAQPLYEALSSKRSRESVVKSFTDDIANVAFRLKAAKKKMFKKPKFMVPL
ncbi:circularly permutated Ras protein 1-like [Chiloscyllium plagiosum]|uniref:circularly permutated Ras protein 1-like n=1 Tax=Chiloscyllium plagiosum TaxID=36176 RepID=UPI001CB85A3A|nr:circularly permutated Ras protein 1-like [Chiloscyllium plagiosum]XP_043536570.1 circularly permutated Ras protein 1-like [Chiloscyllium plagiosum]